jgi:transcriptional regulator with XRE-family HTH domain
MKLRHYLSHNGLTLAAFGGMVGVSHATVSRWLRGEIAPSYARLRKIEEVTGGAVTAMNGGFHAPTITPVPCAQRVQNGTDDGNKSPEKVRKRRPNWRFEGDVPVTNRPEAA